MSSAKGFLGAAKSIWSVGQQCLSDFASGFGETEEDQRSPTKLFLILGKILIPIVVVIGVVVLDSIAVLNPLVVTILTLVLFSITNTVSKKTHSRRRPLMLFLLAGLEVMPYNLSQLSETID